MLYLLLSHFPTLTWQEPRNEEGMEEIWYKESERTDHTLSLLGNCVILELEEEEILD